jgi:hypothetical protein
VFQVTVCHRASRVGKGDQALLDSVGERFLSPDVPLPRGIEVDATHAHLRGVGRAQESGLLGHNLGQVGRAVAEAGGQSAEGVQALPDEAVDADPVALGLVVGPLQGREQAAGPGDGYRDKPQLAKDAGP